MRGVADEENGHFITDHGVGRYGGCRLVGLVQILVICRGGGGEEGI